MKIKVLSHIFNEEFILPHFIRHYRQFTDDFEFYDDGSTDSTVNLVKSYDYNVIELCNDRKDWLKAARLQDTFIQKYRDYDWLIIVDADEFIYEHNFLSLLADGINNNISFFKTKGYEMFSDIENLNDDLLIHQIKKGIPSNFYDKPCIVSPRLIKETNYHRGRHHWKPKGILNEGQRINLYHYKYIGGINKVKKKHNEYLSRIKEPKMFNPYYHEDKTIEAIEYLEKHQKLIIL